VIETWRVRRRRVPPLLIAVTATVIASTPPFLSGALGVELNRDIGVTLRELGVTVSAYFAASALCSAAMGRLSQRVGAGRSLAVASAISAVSLLGAGLAARSFATLAPWIALGGVANSLIQPSVNGFLSDGVRRDGLALALGVKQAAIPVAALLSGACVSVLVPEIGWRGSFLVGAGLALLFSVTVVRLPRVEPLAADAPPATRSTSRTLAALGLAGGLGSIAGNALGGFLVSSAVAGGITQQDAGLVLAVGSAFCVLVRVTAGRWVDRTGSEGLALVSALLLVGAVGFVGLATAVPALLLASSLLAFGGGWGWPGVFQFAVVARNSTAPALATGIAQTGTYLGAAVGPVAFSLIAAWSYSAAWAAVAVPVCASALIMRRCRVPACRASA
jgi:MFS family permease